MRNLKDTKAKSMTPQIQMCTNQRMITVNSHSKLGALVPVKNSAAKQMTSKEVMPGAVSNILSTVLADIIMSPTLALDSTLHGQKYQH